VTITLFDQSGHPVTLMTLNNAWPTKIEPGDLTPHGNDVRVESINLEFESASVAFFKPAADR